MLVPQVDAGLSFNKKDLEHSFIFDIKTFDRVFYLVADTEEDMNKWVRCICDICGFNPTDDGKDGGLLFFLFYSPAQLNVFAHKLIRTRSTAPRCDVSPVPLRYLALSLAGV